MGCVCRREALAIRGWWEQRREDHRHWSTQHWETSADDGSVGLNSSPNGRGKRAMGLIQCLGRRVERRHSHDRGNTHARTTGQQMQAIIVEMQYYLQSSQSEHKHETILGAARQA